jgi:N-acetylglucosaminyldiphosphoundecaprenol N-acetyl-beta-D-mannosaminyltransferase
MVLGVPVDGVQIPEVIARMEGWIAARVPGRFIAVTGMHGVMEAQHDPAFKDVLNAADLVVPDGAPLVWLGRWHGNALARRVYGPELMLAFCQQTAQEGYRHFFYGGAPSVPELLAAVLRQRYNITVAGAYSPPFRPLSAGENEEVARQIRAAAPDILWVGLGTPRQEHWIYDHRAQLGVPLMVGVGAAFDIISGRVKQAPFWMREHGFEWLFRLLQEPRRLWRRYLLYGPEFVLNVFAEAVGLKRPD